MAGFLMVPECVRDLWAKQKSRREPHTDIFEIEAIGPLLLLEAYPEILKGTLFLHFIDNSAALAALVKGSSSVQSGDVIAGRTWSLIAKLGIHAWFDRELCEPSGWFEPWSLRWTMAAAGLVPSSRFH
jgi:hypothetical protein